ncbi:MAG: hypothetical protein IPN53_08190 [Comamonadaceae bacterium]|nr:hypothetical protein [Comamonadaceae bacterium]
MTAITTAEDAISATVFGMKSALKPFTASTDSYIIRCKDAAFDITDRRSLLSST